MWKPLYPDQGFDAQRIRVATTTQVSGACRRRRPLLGVLVPGESRRVYLKDLLSNSLDGCSMYDNKYYMQDLCNSTKLEAGEICGTYSGAISDCEWTPMLSLPIAR